jgi:hypothetical protein
MGSEFEKQQPLSEFDTAYRLLFGQVNKIWQKKQSDEHRFMIFSVESKFFKQPLHNVVLHYNTEHFEGISKLVISKSNNQFGKLISGFRKSKASIQYNCELYSPYTISGSDVCHVLRLRLSNQKLSENIYYLENLPVKDMDLHIIKGKNKILYSRKTNLYDLSAFQNAIDEINNKYYKL